MTFLYNLIIFPIVQFIELCYLMVYRLSSHKPGFALLGVSIAVSVCTLPLYLIAEKHQHKERDLQNRLKPKIDKIKAVFKGDEQYMILSTYYKQNQYHPIYAMRNTFSLLIQIPFFIAAYSYISHLELLQGTSFYFIKDLGLPDGLLSFRDGHFNILPILMTLINVISGMIYAKNFGLKDRIQLYGMSVIFLVLLYHSPSGLVLYWTMNNIFSLAKNILQKTKHSKIIIYCILCIAALFLIVFVIFFHHGYWLKRMLFAMTVSIIFLIPLLGKMIRTIGQKIHLKGVTPHNPPDEQDRIFVVSSLVLFLLAGLVIPSSLIASSVLEFSFIKPYTSPLPFILHTALQAAGIFIVWPFCLYFLFPTKARTGLTILMMELSVIALIDTFFVHENFGFLTNTLIFSEPRPIFAHYNTVILNIAGALLAAGVFLFILFSKFKKVLFPFYIIVSVSLVGLGAFNMGKTINEFAQLQKQQELDSGISEHVMPVYTFSQTGSNVLFIMLDRGISGYLPAIIDEKPELQSVFSGFTWYPNCASFATHTLIGAPPLYGGYEYTPQAINNRNTVTILDKHKEAFLLLPVLFSDAGYSVTITDPPFDNYQLSNISMFSEFPEFHIENISKKYSAYWTQRHPNAGGLIISGILKNNLMRFSFFKISPLAFRLFIYDDGEWLSMVNMNLPSRRTKGGLTIDTIENYAFLDLLPELSKTERLGSNMLTMVYTNLAHSNAFLQAPGYIPSETVTDRGTGPFADEDHYHVNMAAFLLLGKWFSFLKENGVYDNTRIIIVADHGGQNVLNDYPQNILLPNQDRLSRYNPLLMVKDFYAEGDITADNAFMTNADAPLLALESIVDNPINPFTQAHLQSNKAQGIYIPTVNALSSHDHSKYQYRIGKNQWLYVKDNVFDPANWRAVTE